MINTFVELDRSMTINLYNSISRNSFLDNLFLFFSFIGDYALVWVLFLALIIIYEKKHHQKFIKIFFIILISSFIFSNYLLKFSFHRDRPMNKMVVGQQMHQENSLLPYPKDYSFPSGHATTSFAAAATLAYFHKRRKYVFYLTAGLIAFSRVYLGVHYLFDIIAGALLGYLIAKTILNLKNSR